MDVYPFQGAPVKLCREKLALKRGIALVVNSKCANACTGLKGLDDGRKMAAITASGLNVNEEDVFVCSTGTIGIVAHSAWAT